MAHSFTPRFHSSFSFVVMCENFLIAPRFSQPILRFLPIKTTASGSASNTLSRAFCNSSLGCSIFFSSMPFFLMLGFVKTKAENRDP